MSDIDRKLLSMGAAEGLIVLPLNVMMQNKAADIRSYKTMQVFEHGRKMGFSPAHRVMLYEQLSFDEK